MKTVSLVSVLGLAVTAGLTCAGGAAAQDFAMKISAPVPPTEKDITYAWMTAFEKGVEAATDRIDVQLFPANQLGQIPATVEGVAMGTIEMTLPVIGFLGSLDPRFGVLDAAGLFDSEAHAMKTLRDADAHTLLEGFGEGASVEPLVVLVSGQSVIVSSKPIEKVADFKGLKIRTGGATPLLNEPLEKLGASPVALPLGEVLPALQTGGIDASSANMAVLNAFQFQDVATEATYLPGSFTIVGGLVSKDFLAMIGPELEAIVREQAEAALSVYNGYLENGRAGLETAWTKAGGHIHTFSDEEAQSYLSTVEEAVEGIVAKDSGMQADYESLKAAAERNR